ncbi:MAG TPA: GGDEF domain-containing protein [Cellvibrio sp.]|nr:GGDEF domain-containing protein [Cellvibrio sp.]
MPTAPQHSPLIPLYRLLVTSTLLALVAVLAYFVLPERHERILPDQIAKSHLFFDGQQGGQTFAQWVDEKQLHFSCATTTGDLDTSYCGLSIQVGDPSQGDNYSKYQRLELKIKYQGNNQRLRLKMHNFNPANSKSDNRETLKGLDVSFSPKDTRNPIVLHDYAWIASESSQFSNNTLDVVIDLVPPIVAGEHSIQLEYADLYGQLLPAGIWYLGIALVWLCSNLLFISRHLILQERRIRNDSKRLSTLVHFSDDLQQESERYKLLSNTDPLTGILNRNGFAHEISRRASNEILMRNTTMMVIDLDNFKRVNDTHGHDAGDAVLREVARVIHKNTRANDLFVRWGGEEFILFCESTNAQHALLIAEKIRAAVGSSPIAHEEKSILMTVSIGIGVADSQEHFEGLFRRADQALYRAKKLGRNCVVLAEPEAKQEQINS